MSAYQALYRKWRPMKFEDLVGQKHVSDTMRSAIESGRVAHAYLFCGTRGTGKTSTAKIFSRAVNCENSQNGEPCNECETCKGILNGSILDVYEMDAASNRGVESIREIREEVIYTPVGCKYKVYIIDEVHMLTTEAFNALLKTLEEPPAHAIFVLATTDPNKIPQTVLSRCQRFDFKRINADDIAERLSKICEAEGLDVTPDAVEMIAELGDGSMRDAISTLDRCTAFGGEKLTCARVGEITGLVGDEKLFGIGEAIAKGDTREALSLADRIMQEGKEPQLLTENLIEHYRALLICKTAGDVKGLLEKTQTATEKYMAQAEIYSAEGIIYSIKELSEALSRIKWMSKPRVLVESAVVKLCNPTYSAEKEALVARIEKLEKQLSAISSGAVSVAAVPKPADTAVQAEEKELPPWDIEEQARPEADAEAKATDATEEAGTVSVTDSGSGGVWHLWQDALNEIKKESKALYAFLYNAKTYYTQGTVEIEVSGAIAYNKIATPAGIEYLSKLFTGIGGEAVSVKVYIEGQREREREEKPATPTINDLLSKKEMFRDVLEVE